MAYVKVHTIKSAYRRLKYIFDEPAHDDSSERVLDSIGANIHLWGAPDRIYAVQSGYYINLQFQQLRDKAYNSNKKTEAAHIIVSFDNKNEFSTSDPKKLRMEARQINQLVELYMSAHFPECQYVSAVQCDGDGHKLHSHIFINSISTDGTCVRTNKFRIENLRRDWNQCLKDYYLDITGKPYHNPFTKSNPSTVTKPKGWQAELLRILENTRNHSYSISNYKDNLSAQGISVKVRNKKGDWTYLYTVNGQIKHVRDFYQKRNKKTGLVTSTRGLGIAFTPLHLKEYFKYRSKTYQPAYAKTELQEHARFIENKRHHDLVVKLNTAIDNHTSDTRPTKSDSTLDY